VSSDERLRYISPTFFDALVTDYPESFMFHPLVVSLWIFFLILVLCVNIYILAIITSTTQMTLSNYALPWSPNVYLLVGVLIQVGYRMCNRIHSPS
jgi:hypothetical protein